MNNKLRLSSVLAMAAILASIPEHDRYESANQALAYSRGKRLPPDPSIQAIPSRGDVETAGRIRLGQGMLNLAIAEAPSGATVDSVVRNASAQAAGLPFSGDPVIEAAMANSIPAAVALTRLAASAPEVKELMGESPQAQEFINRLIDKYDCYKHEYVLGGCPKIAGDFLGIGSFFKKLIGSDKAKDAVAEAITGSTGVGSSATQGLLSGIALDGESQLSKEKMSEFVSAMNDYVSKAKQAESLAKGASLDAARLTWAQSSMAACDDVASVMAGVNLDSSNVNAFFESVFSTVSYARKTGSTSIGGALTKALASLKGRDAAEGTIAAMFSGSNAISL